MTKHTLVRKIALSGLMLALALIVSLLEGMLPPVVPALPYAKLGLGNVVLLACFVLVGVREGYVVLVLKCLLAAVFQGNVSALVWSLPSAFVAYTAMVLLHRTRLFSVTGLSMAGGMLHNATQIAVAVAVVGKSVVAYLPYMLLAGGIAGFVTGVLCHFVLAFAERGNLTLRPDIVYRRVPREDEGTEPPECGVSEPSECGVPEPSEEEKPLG